MSIPFNTFAKVAGPIERVKTENESTFLFKFEVATVEMDKFWKSKGVQTSKFPVQISVKADTAPSVQGLQVGDPIILNGKLRRRPYQDKKTGEARLAYDLSLEYDNGLTILSRGGALVAAAAASAPVDTPPKTEIDEIPF